jgi:hypothetical protein
MTDKIIEITLILFGMALGITVTSLYYKMKYEGGI